MRNVRSRKWQLFCLCAAGAVLVLGAREAFAINAISEGFKVNGTSQQISAYSSCYEANSTNGAAYFFPSKTSTEFSSFVNHKPAAVNLNACQMLTGGKHTAVDCSGAGGSTFDGLCKFAGSVCPSSWTASGYVDWPSFSCSAVSSYVCDAGTQYTGPTSCSGGSSFSSSGITPSCSYGYTSSSYGAYTTYGWTNPPCGYQDVCGGFPYSCTLQYVCPAPVYGPITAYGEICSPVSETCREPYAPSAIYCE
ncbi:MAG TPA: hypothetical protein VFL98_02975 [Candidatus Paceibacterota bacterium]|nr:hypothetical protein [Candidatus Paceibacterota bacterium]